MSQNFDKSFHCLQLKRKSLNIQHGQNWQVFAKRDFPSDRNQCVSLVVIIMWFLDYYIQWDNIRTFCCCGWWFSVLTHSRSLNQPSASLGSLISKTFVWVNMSSYNNMLSGWIPKYLFPSFFCFFRERSELISCLMTRIYQKY